MCQNRRPASFGLHPCPNWLPRTSELQDGLVAAAKLLGRGPSRASVVTRRWPSPPPHLVLGDFLLFDIWYIYISYLYIFTGWWSSFSHEINRNLEKRNSESESPLKHWTKYHSCWTPNIIYHIIFIVDIMVTNRIMEKKNVQLRQAAPASDFSIIGFFPIRVQNIPEVIRTFFFHNSWRWPLFP